MSAPRRTERCIHDRFTAGGRPLLCAMIDGRAGDPVDVAGTLRSALLTAHGPVRAAASRRIATSGELVARMRAALDLTRASA